MSDAMSTMKTDLFGDLFAPLQEVLKVMVAYMQVIGSFLATFPTLIIDWPPIFQTIAAFFGSFNFDFFNAG